MAQPHYVSETQIVRRVAANPRCHWEFRLHALEKMVDLNPPVTQPDVKNALTKGQVTLEEFKQDVLWRVEGPDLDGGQIKVIAAVFEAEPRIKVVTVF